MQLTTNFSLVELSSSETAVRKGIDNTPSPLVIENLTALADNVLQPLRDWYKKSINITSGYRSVKTNKSIGGSSTSQHCEGKAADFTVAKEDYKAVFEYIKKNLPFDQLIWEFGDDNAPQWIHVSFNPVGSNRKEVLKAVKTLMGTKYIKQ